MPSGEQANRRGNSRERTIQLCNFRAAGRISNENSRALAEIHETFAHHLSTAIDRYLGTNIDVKLHSLEQSAMKDYIVSLTPLSYLAAATLNGLPSPVFIHCYADLVFPMIDLLLGGTTAGSAEPRDLSEIEEELMRDLMSLIASKAQSAWRLLPDTSPVCQRIRSAALHQFCPPNERVTLVRFEMEILNVTGAFQFVLPTSIVNLLVKQSKLDPSRRKNARRELPSLSIRERILDTEFTVAAELPSTRLSVRELLLLQPGYVLKLGNPVSAPGVLSIGGKPIFEAMAVRNGSQKAAQLLRPMSSVRPRKV